MNFSNKNHSLPRFNGEHHKKNSPEYSGVSKNLKFIYPLLLSLLIITACSKNDDDVPSGKFDGSVRSLEEFYNPDLVKALKNLGFNTNIGTNPPNIEGEFVTTPFELKSTSVPDDFEIGKVFSDYTVKFTNQNNQQSTVDYNGNGGGQTDVGSGSLISGDGDSFSVYLKTTSTIGKYPAETAIAISGKITDNGIANIQYAALMLDNKGNIEDTYIENNTGRLFVDGDGLASKVKTKSTKSNRTNVGHAPLSNIAFN